MSRAAVFTLRQVHAIARADLRERRRRFSYLATLAGTLYFLYLVHTGNVRLTIHGQRGVFNSAWIGTLMALSVGSLLSLIGFYLVKNTLDGDRRTGVGEVLAATPMSRAAYTLGKALSNFALLASILVVCAVAAGITQLLAREETRLDLVALLLPMAALAAPPVALAAAMAVLFEAVAWLRGALGNVIFFFLWIGWLSLAAIGPGVDPLGFQLVERSFARQLPAPAGAAAAAAARGGISLNVGPGELGEPGEAAGAEESARPATGSTAAAAATAAKGAGSRAGSQAGTPAARARRPPLPSGIHWRGIDWTAAVIAPRLGWLGIAFAVALMAAVPFSRFDPAREGGRQRRRSRRAATAPRVEPAPPGDPLATPAMPAMPVTLETPDAVLATGRGQPGSEPGRRWTGGRWRQQLAAAVPRSRALVLVIAELRLLLRGRGFWWFAAAAGLWIGGLAAPAGQARATLLAVAWIWPLPLWSEMGAREARYGTRPLVLSAPLPPGLQAAACWAAGIVLTALAGSGVGLRLALAGDARGWGAWLAGCLFIPALALGLGTLSGSPRLFEVVYLLLWYAGPMSGVAELDYTGATAAARAAGVAWIYPTLAAALFTTAWAARARPDR